MSEFGRADEFDKPTPEDSLAVAHGTAENELDKERQRYMELLVAKLREKEEATAAAPAGAEESGGVLSGVGAFLSDIETGGSEETTQVLGGVRDATVNTMNTVDSIGRAVLPKALEDRASFRVGDVVSALEDRIENGPTFDLSYVGLGKITETMTEKAVTRLDKLRSGLASGELKPDSMLPMDWDAVIPDNPQAESVTGGFVRTGAQAVTSFVGGSKALQALKIGAFAMRSSTIAAKVAAHPALVKSVIGAAKGAVGDFTGFDPNAERAADMFQTFFPASVQNPLADYLAADPNDSWYEGRAKNAIEGVVLGGLFEGALLGASALKPYAGSVMRWMKNYKKLGQERLRLELPDIPPGELHGPVDLPRTMDPNVLQLPAQAASPIAKQALELDSQMVFLDGHIADLEMLDEALAKNANGLGAHENVRASIKAEDALANTVEAMDPRVQSLADEIHGLEAKNSIPEGRLLSGPVVKEVSDHFERRRPVAKADKPRSLRKNELGPVEAPKPPKAPTPPLSDDAKLLLKAVNAAAKAAKVTPEEFHSIGALYVEADMLMPRARAKAAADAANKGLDPQSLKLRQSIDEEAKHSPGKTREDILNRRVAESGAATRESIFSGAEKLPPEVIAQARQLASEYQSLRPMIDGLKRQQMALYSAKADLYGRNPNVGLPKFDNYDYVLYGGVADDARANYQALVDRAKANEVVSGEVTVRELQTPAEFARAKRAAEANAEGAARTAASAAAPPPAGAAVPHPVNTLSTNPYVARLQALIEKSSTTRGVMISEEQGKLIVEAIQGGRSDAVSEQLGKHFNFNHLDSNESVKNLIDLISEIAGDSIEKVAGKMTRESITALAEQLGTKTDALERGLIKLSEDVGGGKLAGYAVASRSVLQGMARQLWDMAEKIGLGQATDLEKLNFAKMATRHAKIQAMVKGLQTNIARALYSYNINVGDEIFELGGREMDALLRDASGTNIEELARKIRAGGKDNYKAIAHTVRHKTTSKVLNAFTEWVVNGYLSAPMTHIVNFSNNTAALGTKVLEEVGSASLRAVINRDLSEYRRVTAMLAGYKQGLRVAMYGTKAAFGLPEVAGGGRVARLKAATLRQNSLRQQINEIAKTQGEDAAREFAAAHNDEVGTMLRAFREEAPALVDSGHGISRQQSLSSEAFEMTGDTSLTRGLRTTVDTLGVLTRLPSRSLTTSDELFKAMHYYGELNRLGVIDALDRDLTGDALSASVRDFVSNPSKEIRLLAEEEAKKGTFTQDLQTSGMQKFMAFTNTPGVKVFIPFVRTPTNIVKYTFERTPILNLTQRDIRAALAKGGRDRDLAVTKMFIGSAFYFAGATAAMDKRITGRGPSNPEENAALRSTGWAPYSIWMGDRYVPYNRMDVYGQFLGLAADMVEVSGDWDEKTGEQLAGAASIALIKNLSSKTYLRGLFEIIGALESPDHNGRRVWDSLIGNAVIPNIVAHSRRVADPMIREVYDGYLDPIQARVPGFSDGLFPRRNMLGDPVPYTPGFSEDTSTPARILATVNPFSTSKLVDEPFMNEVRRLGKVGVKMSAFRHMNIGGEDTVDLTAEQADRWTLLTTKEVRIFGKTVREALNDLVQSPAYIDGMTDGDSIIQGHRAKAIETLWTNYKQAPVTLNALYSEFPELKEKVDKARVKRMEQYRIGTDPLTELLPGK